MKRAVRTAIKTLHGIGTLLASSGATLLIFFICCVDSEGEEAWRFLWRIFGAGALLVAAGAIICAVTKSRDEKPMLYFR